MRMTPSFDSKPSISTSSWFSVCSRSSWPPPRPAPRWRPTASISSMKMMQGAFFLPCSNRSRTREAPTPTNISTKSEPEMEKNGTPASPATARARSVLPVPGGPMSSTPFGMRPPSRVNFFGSLRKEMISSSSSLDSSMPATSANVTLLWCSVMSFAFDLPKLIALPPPDCSWRMKKKKSRNRKTSGRYWSSTVTQSELCSGFSNFIVTPCVRELLGDRRRRVDRAGRDELGAVAQVADVVEVLDGDLLHLARLDLLHELGPVVGLRLVARAAGTAARARRTSRSERPRAGPSCRTVARLVFPFRGASTVRTDGARRVFLCHLAA